MQAGEICVCVLYVKYILEAKFKFTQQCWWLSSEFAACYFITISKCISTQLLEIHIQFLVRAHKQLCDSGVFPSTWSRSLGWFPQLLICFPTMTVVKSVAFSLSLEGYLLSLSQHHTCLSTPCSSAGSLGHDSLLWKNLLIDLLFILLRAWCQGQERARVEHQSCSF